MPSGTSSRRDSAREVPRREPPTCEFSVTA
jgi:hypothetical protein